MLTTNGQTYAVLVGVHRGNELWYNKKVLEKNGINVGDKMTFDEFFAAAEKLKAAGVTPLAVRDSGSGIWPTGQLFETTLLAYCGLGLVHAFHRVTRHKIPKQRPGKQSRRQGGILRTPVPTGVDYMPD